MKKIYFEIEWEVPSDLSHKNVEAVIKLIYAYIQTIRTFQVFLDHLIDKKHFSLKFVMIICTLYF